MACIVLLTLITIGCQKDSTEFTPDGNQSQFVTANIFGVVLDENDDPVENAEISYRGNQTISDKNGVYTLNGVNIDSDHNVLNISKDGYHLHSRTFRSKSDNTVQLRSEMIRLEFQQSFQSSAGGTLVVEGASVEFVANSIVTESGDEYQGEVKVAMTYISDDTDKIATRLPGDLSTITKDDQIQSQEFYGAVSVVLQSPDGQKLQIKDGSTAILKISAPDGLNASNTNAGWFDHSIGLWQEESAGTLVGGDVVVEVSHFTWWHIYKSIPHIIISGRVVDQNGTAITNKYIHVFNEDGYVVSTGILNADGTFGGLVPADMNLTFEIYDYSGGCDFPQWIYSDVIGPYSQDTQLGDITITLDGTTLCTVTGTAVDCDGNSITDGFVRLANSYHQITDGSFNASIVVCDNDPVRFVAVDRSSQLSSDAVMVDAPGLTDLSTVSVCGNQADFLTVNCTDLNMELTMLENLQMFYDSNPSDFNYFGFGGSTIDNDLRYDFFMLYQLPTATTFEEGEYLIGPDGSPVTEFAFAVSDTATNTFVNQFILETGSVTITSGGGEGDVIKGSYTYNGRHSITGILYNFYGEFQILY